jgi:hypothetical protein
MNAAHFQWPGGANENSPAFQRWVYAFDWISSPVGTAESFWIGGAMADGFFRPFGTRFPLVPIPTVETVGYFQTSLRDNGDTL